MIFFISLIFSYVKNLYFDPPSSMERVKEISDNVRTLIIPSSVKIIGNDAGKGLSILESVEFEEGSSLNRICTDAFSNCPNLRFVDFSHCSKLWIIEHNAFYRTGLQEVILPESLKNIEKMAFSETQLRTIKIPDQTLWIGEKCFFKSKLEEIIFNSKSVLHQIGDFAFAETLLTKIELPELIDVIGAGAFAGTPLSNVTFLGDNPAFEITNQTIIKMPSNRLVASFARPDSIVYIPSNVIDISYGSFLYSNLSHVIIPPSVKFIRERAFSYSNLVEITIPETVLLIEKYAFLRCKNLQTLVVESTKTEIIAKAFSQTGLKCGVKCPLEMLTKLRYAGISSVAFQECIESYDENSESESDDDIEKEEEIDEEIEIEEEIEEEFDENYDHNKLYQEYNEEI